MRQFNWCSSGYKKFLFVGVWSVTSFIVFNIILFCFNRIASAAENNQSVPFTYNDAFAYIASEMDRLTDGTVIYDDHDSGAAGFYPVNWSGDTADITLSDNSREQPFSGNTCMRIDYNPEGKKGWAGVTWAYPAVENGNWGEKHGRVLVGATELSGYIRGKTGKEVVRIEIGGVNDRKNKDEERPFHDTLSRLKTKPHRLILSKEWQPFTVSIPPGENLTGVIGGFSIFLEESSNPRGATIYVDDVRYNNADLQILRLVRSYRALDKEEDASLRNAAFLYDNALTILALLAKNDLAAANRGKILADTLVWLQNHDRFYHDGRWRNAYLAVPINILADEKARLPGWSRPENGHGESENGPTVSWVEDSYQVGTDTGNMAWTIIALLAAHRRYWLPGRETQYLNAAVHGAEWIERNCRVNETSGGPATLVGKYGGYSGGFDGWENNDGSGPKRLMWRSTEHNIDLFVAFMQLADATGDPAWLGRARHARNFVLKMYDEQEGRFLAGVSDLDGTFNKEIAPLDVQAWSVLAMGQDPEFRRVIAWEKMEMLPAPVVWLEKNVRETAPDAACGAPVGYRFSREGKGIWFEGTAQVALLYKFLNRQEHAERITSYLSGPVFSEENNAGSGYAPGRYAACPEEADTGFHKDIGTWSGQWIYPRRVHLGAVCWYVFAELDVNPFWLSLFPKSP